MLEASFPLALISLVHDFIEASLPRIVRIESFRRDPLGAIRGFLSRIDFRLSKDVSRITQVLMVMSRYDNLFQVALEDGHLAVRNEVREDSDYLEHARLLTRAATSVGGTMLIPASQPGHKRFIFHPTG